MSELAFNLNGEPFELPAAAVGWRVRRIKGRGAPEVVYSREGVPLILPIDADIDDLRHSARGEGRFRLDPVDEHNRMIPQAAAGYVCVQPSESGTELAPIASRTPTDNVAIEAMRLNTELARTIIDRFPMMMDSAAALLRAADGAGLPARAPRAIIEDDDDHEDQDDQDDQDDDQPEEAAPKASGLMGMVETIAPIVMPAIMSAIAGGNLKIPGGIGALMDCRRASPKARKAAAPTPHATSTPGAVPAPGPRDPAPAAGGTESAIPRAAGPRDPARRPDGFVPRHAPNLRTAAPTASPAPTADPIGPHHARFAPSEVVSARAASEVDASAPRRHVDIAPAGADPQANAETADQADDSRSALAFAGDSATESAELPTLDAAALAHFAAIQSALTFREGMLARALASELTPADLRTWLTELRQLSVADAVARIRGVLGDDASDEASGGGS